jgi:hypothetical protein
MKTLREIWSAIVDGIKSQDGALRVISAKEARQQYEATKERIIAEHEAQRGDGPRNGNYLAVGPPANFDDLAPMIRQPKIEFGRCAITGQFGKCVAVDLGSITVDEPNPKAGYHLNDAGEIEPNAFRPAIFASQVVLSEVGLLRLAAYVAGGESPIPGITPDEVYQWEVQRKDGSAQRQFYHEEAEEKRVTWDLNTINWDEFLSLTVRPHNMPEGALPFYSYSLVTHDFMRNGVVIDDLDYYHDEDLPVPDDDEMKVVYFKKVHHTYGTAVHLGSMQRNFTGQHSTVLQVFGWAVGGIEAVIDPEAKTPCCLIGVDERGEWRPYLYR